MCLIIKNTRFTCRTGGEAPRPRPEKKGIMGLKRIHLSLNLNDIFIEGFFQRSRYAAPNLLKDEFFEYPKVELGTPYFTYGGFAVNKGYHTLTPNANNPKSETGKHRLLYLFSDDLSYVKIIDKVIPYNYEVSKIMLDLVVKCEIVGQYYVGLNDEMVSEGCILNFNKDQILQIEEHWRKLKEDVLRNKEEK